jgi:hypothetical protein
MAFAVLRALARNPAPLKMGETEGSNILSRLEYIWHP